MKLMLVTQLGIVQASRIRHRLISWTLLTSDFSLLYLELSRRSSDLSGAILVAVLCNAIAANAPPSIPYILPAMSLHEA